MNPLDILDLTAAELEILAACDTAARRIRPPAHQEVT